MPMEVVFIGGWRDGVNGGSYDKDLEQSGGDRSASGQRKGIQFLGAILVAYL